MQCYSEPPAAVALAVNQIMNCMLHVPLSTIITHHVSSIPITQNPRITADPRLIPSVRLKLINHCVPLLTKGIDFVVVWYGRQQSLTIHMQLYTHVMQETKVEHPGLLVFF